MKGSEFIRLVKKLGKDRGVTVTFDETRGKGSHCTIYFGTSFTVVRNLKDELKTGTLHGMLDQLGLTLKDIQ